MSRSLVRRVERSTRPKVLVAGLSKDVEAFFDLAGEYMGAVSTFSIYHAADDKWSYSIERPSGTEQDGPWTYKRIRRYAEGDDLASAARSWPPGAATRGRTSTIKPSRPGRGACR